jgi:hypothetical protein
LKSLISLQRALSDAIRSPSKGPAVKEPDFRLENEMAPSARGMRPLERLEIYREQFWLRHLSNLQEDYPTFRWVVGDATFEELVAAYLRAFPPRTWDLERLGEDLPSFAEGTANLPPLAVAAARLDWAFMESFAAPDAAPFDDAVLASAPEDAWPGARIAFHPSLRPLALSHPVHRLRQTIQRGEPPERPAPETTHVVVWRDRDLHLKAVAIDAPAFELLTNLRAGVPLGLACERVANAGPEPSDVASLGQSISQWFQQWTASSWVSSVCFE